jgi:hypothetical protein
MAAPFSVLRIDMYSKCAAFVSGMSEAHALRSVKSRVVHLSGNMFASRHAVMVVSKSLGVQMLAQSRLCLSTSAHWVRRWRRLFRSRQLRWVLAHH